MRVLLLANDCNPEWPSLPVVGYKMALALAKRADVLIATHVRNRKAIEKAGVGRASIRFFDNEYVARPLYKISTWLRGGTATAWSTALALSYPSNIAFEWEIWKGLRDELRDGRFDLVHRLTPMSPTIPSPMAAWSPVPFVLGPLNGGLKWPRIFRKERAREGEWLSYVRNAYRVLPYYGSTYQKARAVLAAFPHTIADLPSYAKARAINFPEVGIDPKLFFDVPSRSSAKSKTILFVGRFVPYKLPQLLVRAFATQPELRSHRLIMIGDGPERAPIEQLIRKHDLEGCVDLLGWKTQTEVASEMRKADIFAFPSIRELGAGVVVEAMACGLACVVTDYGGPATLISADRGVKVTLGNFDELTRGFGEALLQLTSDGERIVRLGSMARQHVMQNYTWDAKAAAMLSVYEWVLGRGQRPNLGLDATEPLSSTGGEKSRPCVEAADS